ncbi:AMP-binding protein [Sinomonas sp. ASV322]|uniref:AMP-binding protein n=1 Tax=Sinomonas sp. ASV322 TaxID=3041920 RepID=UPI0027DC0BB6|nr:AMP-binding protein [Sinomonas sp. ASV322]MDQ4503206.1 AMP-binding protein [Sinomonas sp. ASV322]
MALSTSAHVDSFTRDNLPPESQWPTFEFTLPELQYPDRLNAGAALIDHAVERFGPDRTALIGPDGTRWTYGELQTRANQVAQVLTEDLGLVPGNRVLLRSPNNPWTVAAWLGTLKAGGVAVTTMFALRSAEIVPIIERTQPSAALVDHRFADDLDAALAELGSDRGQVAVVRFGGDGADDLTARVATKSGIFEAVPTAADDVALLGPTSGSTGVPKITMHFHRDILANADTFARHLLHPTPDDVFACSAPLAFTFGLGSLVVFPLRFGASSLLVERATPVQFAELVAANGVTILATAPTAYRAILKAGRADLLAGVKKAVSAGEHLPQETWHHVHDDTGLKLINGIGATELLHVFISAAGEDIRPSSTGRAVPGYRATILDADGNEAAPGELGRLAVIGPTGCRYLADERQLSYVVNGWNVTGDMFYRDADGYFYYQARSDDMIVSSGYNIGAPEVEAAVNEHPDVLECGVVGRPDSERGTVVCAFVVLRDGVDGDDAKRKEIQDFVKSRIAPYKYPRDVRFVDALPRNPSGKLQHFRLREQAAETNGTQV